MGVKTKNLPRLTRFGFWLFYKGVVWDNHLSKKTTFEWPQEWLSYTGLTVLKKSPRIGCFWISWSICFENYSIEQLFDWIKKLNIFQVFIFMDTGFYFQNVPFSEYTGFKLILYVYLSNWERFKQKIVPYKLCCFTISEILHKLSSKCIICNYFLEVNFALLVFSLTDLSFWILSTKYRYNSFC